MKLVQPLPPCPPHLLLDARISDLIRKSARKLSRSDGFCPHEAEDIEQELTTHLIAKGDRYDPAKAPTLAFANTIVKRKVVSMVRHRFAQRRDPRRVDASLNAICTDENGHAISYYETLPNRDARHAQQLRSDVAAIIEGLPASAAAKVRQLLRELEHGEQTGTVDVDAELRTVLWREFSSLVDGAPPVPSEAFCVVN